MESPPHGAPWATQAPIKTNGTSVFALAASVSGFVCLLGFGGALGIALGLIARSEIRRSEGRETGARLASAAIVVGLLNIGIAVIGMAMAIAYLARPSPTAVSRSVPAITPPSYKTPAPSPGPRGLRTPPRVPAPRASHEQETRVTSLGTITVADIVGDFAEELEKQRRAAATEHESLLLWLVVPNCKPCDGVSAALTSAIAQKALAKVRFVRVDRDDFQGDLEQLGIPTENIPGFVVLDAHNRPRDFIHGGEWDADIPANVAPVLGKFAHGSYSKRRHPWRAPPREDETTL